MTTRRSSTFQLLLFVLIFGAGGGLALAAYGTAAPVVGHAAILAGAFVAASIAAAAI